MAKEIKLWHTLGRVIRKPGQIVLILLSIATVPLAWLHVLRHYWLDGALTVVVILFLSALWELHLEARNENPADLSKYVVTYDGEIVPHANLEIVHAMYGVDTSWKEVTDIARKYVHGDRFDVLAGNEPFDPSDVIAPGRGKYLKVIYTLGTGDPVHVDWQEGQRAQIPEEAPGLTIRALGVVGHLKGSVIPPDPK